MMGRLFRRIRYWFRHRQVSRELAEEMELHRTLRQRDLEGAGLPANEAASASRRALGNTLIAGEDARRVWIWPWLETLSQDLLYGFRILRRTPVFTAAAILTLALGIGANTAVFSAVKAVLLKPLSYPNAERLVMVWESNRAVRKDRDAVAPLNFLDWAKETSVFRSVGAYRDRGFVITAQDEPQQVRALSASASLFEVLGTDAAIGRTFREEEVRNQDRVVVLGHEFWQRRFGGDRSLIGKSLSLSGTPYLVLGVMPPQFRFPDSDPLPVDIYTPLVFEARSDLQFRNSHTLAVIARLADGESIETATAHINQVARRIAEADPNSNPEVTMSGIHEVFVEDVRLALLVTLGAVTFLLLIACANVANLKVAQGLARSREMAVRAALGAGRWRLLRQLVTENVLLSVVGGIAGLVLARWTIRAFLAVGPNMFGFRDVAIDLQVLIFTLLISMITGIAFGLVPALKISRANLNDTLKVGSGRGKQVARPVLVIVEVMLSLLLAASAGLMVRTVINLRSLDYGFRPESLYTIQLFVPQAKYPGDPTQFRPRAANSPQAQLSTQARVFNDIVDRLKAAPGVQNAAAVSSLPLSPIGVDFDLPVFVEGRPRPRAGEELQADFRIATADYFQTMGIPMVAGRGFTEADGPNTASVIVINEALARRLFGSENPLGRRIVFYGIPREVIGVAKSVRHRGFRIEPNAEMTVPSKQFQQFGGMTLVLRSDSDAASLQNLIKRELREIDPELALSNARTMVSLLGASTAQPRFTTLLLGAFALLAVVLAGIGMYGVVCLGITQRTREIGVRMALGARRSGVIGLFVKDTMILASIGIVCGLAAAIGVTRLMRGLLFGVAPSDPVSYVAAVAVLVVAAFVASWGPARRATRVDPLRSLRHD